MAGNNRCLFWNCCVYNCDVEEDVINDDEREAREWLRHAENFQYLYEKDAKHRATILALLDRPPLPRPEDVSYDALYAFTDIWDNHTTEHDPARLAYRAFYNHYAQPPAPKPLGWAVLGAFDYGGPVLFYDKQNAIVFSNKYGGRIVKLVEDRDDQ